ncbi:hypothetical protein D9613_010082 [Agrocybe pediades]|uniref:Uncharacterized protein n=1 Tax=Agrocybe pediades TaxID=84607 RepID=A0A8H4VT01_9AGAR|nr:hypothetical protein D9613_010082 [Agrocybe pediades]
MESSYHALENRRPPSLFPVSETQAFSGESTTSTGSSSSSAASAYFDRLSRGSAASAYLTDFTPPVTPLHSNSGRDHKQKVDPTRASQDFISKFHDERHVSTNTVSPDSSADHRGIDEDGRNPFDIVATKISRTMPSMHSRRALEIIEKRKNQRPNQSSSNSSPDNSQLLDCSARSIVITQHNENVCSSKATHVEEVATIDHEEAFQLTGGAFSLRNLTLDGSDRGLVPDTSCYVSAYEQEGVLEPAIQLPKPTTLTTGNNSPQLPGKPRLLPTELDSDYSPLLLSRSPSLESVGSASIFSVLSSPIHHNMQQHVSFSPIIYSDTSYNGHSPAGSPVTAISSIMFSSRFSRQTTTLTGEDLDIPSLLRLEVAASAEGMPPVSGGGVLSVVGTGLEAPWESPAAAYSSSSNEGHSSESCSLTDDHANITNHPSLLPTTGATSQSDAMATGNTASAPASSSGPVIGLGLGLDIESSLRASSSVTRLSSLLEEEDAAAAAERKKDIINYTNPLPAGDFVEPQRNTSILNIMPRRRPSCKPRKSLPRPKEEELRCNSSSIPDADETRTTSKISKNTSPDSLLCANVSVATSSSITQSKVNVSRKPRTKLTAHLLQRNLKLRDGRTLQSNFGEELLIPAPRPPRRPSHVRMKKLTYTLVDAASPRPDLEQFLQLGFPPFTLSRKEGDLLGSKISDCFADYSCNLGAQKHGTASSSSAPRSPIPLSPSQHPTLAVFAHGSISAPSTALPPAPATASASHFIEQFTPIVDDPSPRLIQAEERAPGLRDGSIYPNASQARPFPHIFKFVKPWFPAKFKRKVRNLVAVPGKVAL